MAPERFEFVEHTADAGIRARGRDLAELFSNAAAGMLELVADTAALPPGEACAVRAAAPGPEELMVAWLEELLYLSETRDLLLRCAVAGEAGENEVAGTAWGVPAAANREALRGELKAVTRHRLEVRPDPAGGWTCQVFFDV